MKKNKIEEDTEKKVDDVSIKKGILTETVEKKEKKKMNKVLKTVLIVLLVLIVLIIIHMVRNHVIIQKLIKESKVMGNYSNYSCEWITNSTNGMTLFKSYVKDGVFIEYYSGNFIEDNLIKNYNSLFKGVKNEEGKYDVVQYYADNTYTEYTSELANTMSIAGDSTIQLFEEYPTIIYLRMLLTTIVIPTTPDGINCYELLDFSDLRFKLYIDKETGLTYKSIFDSKDTNVESTDSKIIFEIGNVTDEDLQVPNVEQYTKNESNNSNPEVDINK